MSFQEIGQPKPLKSAELLHSFQQYCYAHPDERFWQALRNWCGWPFIFVGKNLPPIQMEHRDTFYWEKNEGV